MKGEPLGDRALLLDDADVVATAIADLEPDETLPYRGRRVAVAEAIPFGHKLALRPLEPGDPVIKYGEVIGTVTKPIDAGSWVHIHNCRSNRGGGELEE